MALEKLGENPIQMGYLNPSKETSRWADLSALAAGGQPPTVKFLTVGGRLPAARADFQLQRLVYLEAYLNPICMGFSPRLLRRKILPSTSVLYKISEFLKLQRSFFIVLKCFDISKKIGFWELFLI